MARRKKTSQVLVKGEQRLLGLKAISDTLDLGAGVSVAGLGAAVAGLKADLDTYNLLLSQADERLNALTEHEKALADLCERALAAVAGKYGKNSSEYEKAGGVRKSERKRPAKAPAA